jgi:DNA (cytosine-5)-methyltransferase 1
MTRNYRVLSLFSGMGGADVGFAGQVVVRRESVDSKYIRDDHEIPGFVNLKRLPFEVVFQNDILPGAKEIAELNGWAHNYHVGDIRNLLLQDGYTFPHADVIIGGFPCQDFSHAGKRQGLNSQRGTLYQSYVEVVRRVRPLVFFAENVHGLLTMPGNPVKTITEDFACAGYVVKHQLVRCEEIGVPQTRWRVVIMGVRSDKSHALPHDDVWNVLADNRRRCPVGPYLAHLDEPATSTDPAQQQYSKARRLERGQGQKEVNLQGFAPTIRAEHHGNIEFRRVAGGQNNEPDRVERRLTVREAALIQTFPPTCLLTGARPSMVGYKAVGNAVPPLLGYLVAVKVLDLLQTIQESTSSDEPG